MGENQALVQLGEILSRPEYRVDDGVPWWQQLLAPVLDWLWGVVTELYQLVISSASGREGALGLVAVLVSVTLLGGAAVYLVRAVRLSVLRESRQQLKSVQERRERSDQLWQSAQRLAEAGQLPEAARLIYLSALYALDERALLHLEQAQTNGEHAARLRARDPGLGDTFGQLVNAYEQIRYGHAPVSAAVFSALSSRAEHVRSAALAGAA